MEGPTFQTQIQWANSFNSTSFTNNGQSKIALPKNLGGRLPTPIIERMPRRSLLQFVVFNPIFLNAYPILGEPIQKRKESEVIRTEKLASGVSIQCKMFKSITSHVEDFMLVNPKAFLDLPSTAKTRIDILEGEGPEAREGDLVEVNYVCRRSNGYFVHSTVDQFSGESFPVKLPLDEKQIIKGLKEVLVGMKVGGKRRALIPPSAGYLNEDLQPVPDEFGHRRRILSHANEPLVFEVQLLKVL